MPTLNNLSPFEEKCSELITQQSVEEKLNKKNHNVHILLNIILLLWALH